MFFNGFLKSFRILLLPFALVYGLIILLRNWLYDKQINSSVSFGLPVICIGNLSVGGTGKSPMVEYMVLHLKNIYKVATLSRGYKRKTRGYVLTSDQTTAIDVGDEPMQFHRKFPDIPVAVGEERVLAIPQLLHDRPEIEVIILDDAFQHREIKAGLNILLTEYDNLFTRDFYLPTGDLRDSRRSYKRADIIVVTKCRPDMSSEERNEIIEEIEPLEHQRVFFSAIAYGTIYHITRNTFGYIDAETEILLVTGIANPKPLKKYLEEQVQTYQMLHFNDHHIFSIDDWREIKKRFKSIEDNKKMILTTEKDAMRLQKFAQEIDGMPFYVLPIEHKILFNESDKFTNRIIDFIDNFKQPV